MRSAVAVLLACLLPGPAAAAEPVHAIAMHGAPKHRPGFQHFPYVDPAAPKGGRLVLGALGTFDSLNAFIVRGVTPGNIREYVYESLMTRGGDEPFTLYGLIAKASRFRRTAAPSPSTCAARPAFPTARRSVRGCSSEN